MSVFLDTAIEAAKEAEKVILQYYGGDFEVEMKTDDTPVTVADKKAEEVMRDFLRARFPTHGFLGEEYGNEAGAEDYTWLIDPIDGTKNFTRGIPYFGTLLSLMHEGKPVLGVSNLPATGELLYAEKGQGAFCDGVSLQMSDVADPSRAYIHSGELPLFERAGKLDALLKLGEQAMTLRVFGDCAMYHFLAKGQVDAVVEGNVYPWDIAPAAVFITELGGIVTDLEGKEIGLESRSALATNKQLHPQIVALFS